MTGFGAGRFGPDAPLGLFEVPDNPPPAPCSNARRPGPPCRIGPRSKRASTHEGRRARRRYPRVPYGSSRKVNSGSDGIDVGRGLPASAVNRPGLRGRVAPPLRRVKGAHETPHKPPLRSGWWRSSWTSLDPSSLRCGFAGSKADDDARRRHSALPAGARC